jgi:hypothetical protein
VSSKPARSMRRCSTSCSRRGRGGGATRNGAETAPSGAAPILVATYAVTGAINRIPTQKAVDTSA